MSCKPSCCGATTSQPKTTSKPAESTLNSSYFAECSSPLSSSSTSAHCFGPSTTLASGTTAPASSPPPESHPLFSPPLPNPPLQTSSPVCRLPSPNPSASMTSSSFRAS